MNLMELREVRKIYRQGGARGRARTVTAVDGISLSIEPGRCLAVVGPSGSGKSTLGRLVLGLEKPDSGMVLFRGNPLHGLRGKEKHSARRSVQVVFQNSQGAVNPRFTAMKIIAEPLVNFDGLSGAALTGRIGELMEMVGMDAGDTGKLPHQFSGGELQRICLARALASKPDLIVLDEAVSSLDMLNQSRILGLLADIKRGTGTAFLFISHDLRAVSKLADALVVVEKGRIAHAASDIHALREHPESAGHAFAALAAAVLPPEPAAGFRHRL